MTSLCGIIQVFSLISFECLADNRKVIYFILSSSAYDESYISKISELLKSKGYTIETKYLN